MMLSSMCAGDDAAAGARSQRVAVAGAMEAAVAGMRANEQTAEVQAHGVHLLLCLWRTAAPELKRVPRPGLKNLLQMRVVAFPQSASLQHNAPLLIRCLEEEEQRFLAIAPAAADMTR